MGNHTSKQQNKNNVTTDENNIDGDDEVIIYNEQDYEDLIYISKKREIKITIQKSTQAGITAGLCVMGGVLVAGPIGAAIGGTIGTTIAVKLSKNVISLNQLLQDTPHNKRSDICKLFATSFKEEFHDSIQSNPELKLILSGTTPIGIVRYMVEREMIQNEQMKKLDGILTKISG